MNINDVETINRVADELKELKKQSYWKFYIETNIMSCQEFLNILFIDMLNKTITDVDAANRLIVLANLLEDCASLVLNKVEELKKGS